MTSPFNSCHRCYEVWFTRHEAPCLSELFAVRALLPWEGRGLEIGVGTARFAAPLCVEVGIGPSEAVLTYAIERGISCVQGVAEALLTKPGDKPCRNH